MSALRRVGHKGADLIAPGNTPASFDAALAAGVDMIEFDVLPRERGRADSALVLAHDYGDAVEHAISLDEGLAHLASSPFAAVELDVDIKAPGYEDRVVDALRGHGLIDRALVTSQWMRSLVRVRAQEPRLRLGWSVPRVKRDYTKRRIYALPLYAAVRYVDLKLPATARRHIADGRCEAIMAHHRLVTPRLVRAVREAGGDVYVWTVDDAAHIGRLEALGVTGVITNDPRLFAQLPSTQVAAE
jgi:glycerophosphoryl diester phosphodiesterase